jgi:hypothetical protein
MRKLLVACLVVFAACADSGSSETCGNGALDDGERCDPALSRHPCPASETCEACPMGLTLCGDSCIDTQTAQAHCGACGAACSAGSVCDGAGACALSCQAGLTDCNGTCADTNSDRANCGSCGNPCEAGFVCGGAGTCELSCQAGLVDCAGTCIDPVTDRTFCGATGTCMGSEAGVTCGAGEVCNGAGSCELSCQAGLLACNGTCIDPGTDRAFCGASGDCTGTNAGEVCAAGFVCDGAGSCALSCQAGLENCAGTCSDTSHDPNNCGACGTACLSNEACVAGTCTAFTTLTPAADCTELLATPTIWGEACTGLDLRARTAGTLHFLGCVDSESCTFYCNYDAAAQTLSFGTTGTATLRAQIDPGDAAGDGFSATTYECCSAANPTGVCNAPNAANNGVPFSSATALCRALGYGAGTIVREVNTNFCPEAHTLDATGESWTSDFVESDGYGAEYQCSGFQMM